MCQSLYIIMFYAPNFKEVGGAYDFWVVGLSARLSCDQDILKIIWARALKRWAY